MLIYDNIFIQLGQNPALNDPKCFMLVVVNTDSMWSLFEVVPTRTKTDKDLEMFWYMTLIF